MLLGSAGVSLNVWAEARVGSLRVGERSYFLPFPDGFCDATESVFGIVTLSMLKKLYAKNTAIGKPKVIFRPCNAKEEKTFPWGFAGSFPKYKFINNQKSLNKFRRRLFEDGKLTKDIARKYVNKNKDFMQTYGFELGVSELGKPSIIWDDDNLSITKLITKARLNGLPYRELMITATTVINGRMINLVTYDEVGNFLNPKAYILDLAKNAARFKSMNRFKP